MKAPLSVGASRRNAALGDWRALISIKLATIHVMDAVVALSTRPSGFTLAQVAEAVQQRAAPSAKAYTLRNAAYDLAKLSGKKLIHRVKGSRRYKADPSGVRAMCAYLVLRDKVIKPLLAGVVRPFVRAPKVQAPIDQHYVRLREESSTEPLKPSASRRLEKTHNTTTTCCRAFFD
jgi:hypothetical protein